MHEWLAEAVQLPGRCGDYRVTSRGGWVKGNRGTPPTDTRSSPPGKLPSGDSAMAGGFTVCLPVSEVSGLAVGAAGDSVL